MPTQEQTALFERIRKETQVIEAELQRRLQLVEERLALIDRFKREVEGKELLIQQCAEN